ncbi:MAG: shikimate dehydrogenase [Neisseriaceae bacterium]
MGAYQLAVFGDPIQHSLSPQIHSLFAQQLGLSISYYKLLVKRGHLATALRKFHQQAGHGANLTLPLKEEAFALLEHTSIRAGKAKAVNTLIRDGPYGWYGDNTDGVGLVNAIKTIPILLKDKKILVIGAGGACRGVLYPLLKENPVSITVTNRTVEKARLLADEFGIAYISMPGAHKKNYDMVINATSSTLQGKMPEIHPQIFSGCELAYDMMYGVVRNPFLSKAREHQVPMVSDGLGMLVYQAAESFFLWTGQRPAVQPVLYELARLLGFSEGTI